jgi:uncharacterized protein (DUF305 family)
MNYKKYSHDEARFITDMIEHHQMAIDMCRHIHPDKNSQDLLVICRDITWQQNYEIWYMKQLLNSKKIYSDFLGNKNKTIIKSL